MAAESLPQPAGGPAVQIERALHLCQVAEQAANAAAGVRADSRRRRSERRHWAAILAAYQPRSGEVMRCCAYCARMPGPEGNWAAIPLRISQFLHSRASGAADLSHAYCPDCLERHFPAGEGGLEINRHGGR